MEDAHGICATSDVLPLDVPVKRKRIYEAEGTSEFRHTINLCIENEETNTFNMRSKQTAIPCMTRVEILKRLENGDVASELAKKYGVSAEVINSIETNKTKLVDFVNEVIRRDESALELHQRQPVCPPLQKTVQTLDNFDKEQPKQAALSIVISVEILKRLENGENASKLAKKYGVSAEVIRGIETNKNKLVDYVNEAIAKGDESVLQLRQMQPVCPRLHRRVHTLEDLEKQKPLKSALPVKTRFEILKQLENGEDASDLASKYSVNVKTIRNIGRQKNELLDYVNEVIKRGNESDLELLRIKSVRPSAQKKTQSPGDLENENPKRTTLSLMLKAEILKKLENGEDIFELAKHYGVSVNVVRNMGKNRKKILDYVDNAKVKGDESALNLPHMKRVRPSLQKKIKILDELEKGESSGTIARKYNVGESVVRYLRKRRNEILKGQRIEKNRINRLCLQTKLKIIKELEKGKAISELAIKYDVDLVIIRSIERQKTYLLNLVQKAMKRGDKSILKTKRLQPTGLSFQTKVNIIQELDKGESLSTVAEKYDLLERTILKIMSNKHKILTFVKESIERGDKKVLKKQRMYQVYLSPKKKIELLEDLEKGESIPMIAEKYGVAKGTVGKMRIHKNEVLNKLEKKIKTDKESNLKMRIKRLRISLNKKANILKDLRKGMGTYDLSKKYNMSLSKIQSILLEKGNIIEYTEKSVKGKENSGLHKQSVFTQRESDESSEDSMPLSNIRSMMLQQGKILKSTQWEIMQRENPDFPKNSVCNEEESDESSEDNMPLSKIRSIMIQKRKIVETAKRSMKQREESNFSERSVCTNGESGQSSAALTVPATKYSELENIEISSEEEEDDLTEKAESSHNVSIKEEPPLEIAKVTNSENMHDVTVKEEENFDDLEFIICKVD